jgi:hypothetical protein
LPRDDPRRVTQDHLQTCSPRCHQQYIAQRIHTRILYTTSPCWCRGKTRTNGTRNIFGSDTMLYVDAWCVYMHGLTYWRGSRDSNDRGGTAFSLLRDR